MKIAIIGAGNLGISIADGLYINNMITELYLTKNNISTLTKWNKIPNIFVTSNNVEAVKNSDIIILCVQPSQFKNLSIDLKKYFERKTYYNIYYYRLNFKYSK